MKLRVGIIGLGEAWETRQRPALRALSDRFEVRAVCCEVAHLAQQAARDFGACEVDGFRALCGRDDVDAVLILAPEWYGPLPVLAACDYGKSVYCGAALDIDDPSQAKQLRQRVEQAGIAFMAEFPRRFAPATLRLKELIATRLGVPKLIFCHRRPELPHDAPRDDRAGRLVPLRGGL
jgi:predicted dehydrogenase